MQLIMQLILHTMFISSSYGVLLAKERAIYSLQLVIYKQLEEELKRKEVA